MHRARPFRALESLGGPIQRVSSGLSGPRNRLPRAIAWIHARGPPSQHAAHLPANHPKSANTRQTTLTALPRSLAPSRITIAEDHALSAHARTYNP